MVAIVKNMAATGVVITIVTDSIAFPVSAGIAASAGQARIARVIRSYKIGRLDYEAPEGLLHGSSNGLAGDLPKSPEGELESQPSQWVIETLASSVYAGVFQCRVSRGRVFNFLATVSNWAWLTAERSAPLG